MSESGGWSSLCQCVSSSVMVNRPSRLITCVGSRRFEQPDGFQVFRCRDGERQNVADGLMKARIGSAPEAHRLVLVLQVVLDVSHLVVHGEELLHRHCGALLDPEEVILSTVTITQTLRIVCLPAALIQLGDVPQECWGTSLNAAHSIVYTAIHRHQTSIQLRGLSRIIYVNVPVVLFSFLSFL